MATMMGDVTRALKQLPCVSVAAIDGKPNIYLLHVILHSLCILFAFRSALRIMLIELNKYDRQYLPSHVCALLSNCCSRRAPRRSRRGRRRAVVRLRPARYGFFFLNSVTDVFPTQISQI